MGRRRDRHRRRRRLRLWPRSLEQCSSPDDPRPGVGSPRVSCNRVEADSGNRAVDCPGARDRSVRCRGIGRACTLDTARGIFAVRDRSAHAITGHITRDAGGIDDAGQDASTPDSWCAGCCRRYCTRYIAHYARAGRTGRITRRITRRNARGITRSGVLDLRLDGRDGTVGDSHSPQNRSSAPGTRCRFSATGHTGDRDPQCGCRRGDALDRRREQAAESDPTPNPALSVWPLVTHFCAAKPAPTAREA